MIILVSFIFLTALSFLVQAVRRQVLARNGRDWVLDASGLLIQGIAIPFLQITFIYGLLSLFLPQAKGALAVSPWLAFLLNFVFVDYLYYWNHRLLHGKTLWKTHAVHHTAEHLDLFITSRNTLWTSLLIVYLWANGLFIFLLKDPRAFILSASITASLDLWRHTSFYFTPASRAHRLLAMFLITPNEHAWHHSRNQPNKNFGANLSFWDKLHGTYYSPAKLPQSMGIPLNLNVTRMLLFPFKEKSSVSYGG
jgi:sterol desaturase/sphingolipid hydroxylase (fatty acid hydroxylase superfamily)